MLNYLIATLTALIWIAHHPFATSSNDFEDNQKMPTEELRPLKPVGSMPMSYYPVARKFRYPIPTDFEFSYIDTTGKVVIAGPFVYAQSFSNGVAKVRFSESFEYKDDKWKLHSFSPQMGQKALLHKDGTVEWTRSYLAELDEHGKVVVHPKAPPLPCDLFEGLAVSGDHTFGYEDAHGNIVIPPRFSVASRFSDGLAAVGEKRPWTTFSGEKDLKFYYPCDYSFIDKSGRKVINGPFLQAEPFAGGLAAVMFSDGKWGFIDKLGKTVIPGKYDWAGSFTGEYAPVEFDMKVGFINQKGEQTIPFKFKDARSFSIALAPATLDGEHWGFIDREGKFAIKPTFLGAFSFSDGFALVYNTPGLKPENSMQQAGIFYKAAVLSRAAENWNSARAACLRAIDIAPGSPAAESAKKLLVTSLPDHYLSAEIEQKYIAAKMIWQSDPEKWERLYLEIVKEDPSFMHPYCGLAFRQNQQRNFDKAIEILRNLLKDHPEYARAWFVLSESYRGKGDTEEANKSLKRARELAIDDPLIDPSAKLP